MINLLLDSEFRLALGKILAFFLAFVLFIALVAWHVSSRQAESALVNAELQNYTQISMTLTGQKYPMIFNVKGTRQEVAHIIQDALDQSATIQVAFGEREQFIQANAIMTYDVKVASFDGEQTQKRLQDFADTQAATVTMLPRMNRPEASPTPSSIERDTK